MINKENKKGKMTMDRLAILMKAGFGGVDKKIDNLDKKNDSLDQKIDHIEDLVDKLAASTLKGFENIEAKMATKEDIENLEKRMDSKMDTRIEGLKGQIEGVNNRIDDISLNRVKYKDHDQLKTRVDFIEEKLEIQK